MKTTFGAWLLGVCGSIAILVGCSSAAQDSDRAGAESGGASTAETAGAAHTAGAGDRTPSTDESSAGAEAGAGGSNAGSSHGDAAAACEEYAVALCHKIAICNAWLLAAEFADEAACVKRWGTAGGCVGSFALVGTSRTVDGLAACTSAMNRATCAEWLDSDPVALAACSAKPGSLWTEWAAVMMLSVGARTAVATATAACAAPRRVLATLAAVWMSVPPV